MLKEAVDERPDAMECVRILMKALYDVPLTGATRQNKLEQKVKELFAEPSEEDEDRSFMTDCFYLSLSDLVWFCFLILPLSNHFFPDRIPIRGNLVDSSESQYRFFRECGGAR